MDAAPGAAEGGRMSILITGIDMPRHGMVINIYPDGRVADHFDEFQETIATAVSIPPQTRGDSIRAKSDEKLANFLVECCGCPPDLVDREYCGAVGCLKCWLNWLKKEC